MKEQVDTWIQHIHCVDAQVKEVLEIKAKVSKTWPKGHLKDCYLDEIEGFFSKGFDGSVHCSSLGDDLVELRELVEYLSKQNVEILRDIYDIRSSSSDVPIKPMSSSTFPLKAVMIIIIIVIGLTLKFIYL